jgi:hypothetical protein
MAAVEEEEIGEIIIINKYRNYQCLYNPKLKDPVFFLFSFCNGYCNQLKTIKLN